nr:S-(hydroxymethyl)glutathione dehydrogenase [Proteus mirabilis]
MRQPFVLFKGLTFQGKRIKWLILPLHESETDRHLIGLSG